MKQKQPEEVIREALAEYKRRLDVGPDAMIEKVFESIKALTGPVKVGIEAFEFIVASLTSAFPDAGYDKWAKGTPAYEQMKDRIEQHWSNSTGSGL